jgi:hypothetical protein
MGSRRKPPTDELIVEELRALRRSVDALSANTGKWLAAVAMAAANPADNSTEVQKAVDKIAAELNASATAEEDALKNFNQPKEN